MKPLFTFLFLAFCSAYARGQALVIDSTRFITGLRPSTDIISAIPTADKGILFVGYDWGNPGGIIPFFPADTLSENALIGKIDSNRHISWLKVYGGSGQDGAGSAVQTPDGGYAVLGGTESDDGDVTGYKGGGDFWLLRLDANGNLLWQKCYGSTGNDGGYSVANTPDHGFIMLGFSNGSGGDVPFHYGGMFSEDWVVIKIDSVGNVQWSKDLGGTGDEYTGSILSVDSCYYLVSSTTSTDHDCTDTGWHAGVSSVSDDYILKLDAHGNVLWDSAYGGSDVEQLSYAMYDTADSTIVMIGDTYSNDYMVTGNHGGKDMWVAKVKKDGTLMWQKTLGSPGEDNGTGICKTYDNGYIAYGTTGIGPIGATDAWLFAIDSGGSEIANKVFGGVNHESSFAIVPYLDAYAATGYSESAFFTEGTTYGGLSYGQNAFVSYIDYWPLETGNINNKTGQLTVYPNPADENIRIMLPEKGNCNLTITNILGQLMFKEEVIHTNVNVIINNWPDGLYMIKCQSENGNTQTIRLIKN